MAINSRNVNGVQESGGALIPGWLSNLGMTLSAGTLTITDAGGTALSTTNPGYVTMPSTTGGLTVCLRVTAGGTFNDDAHASSSLTNLGFGITEAAAWANDMPYFLYVVNRANSNIDGADGSSAFFISRSPCMATTPSSGDDIGDTGAIPVNDSQNVILISDDVTVANYVSLPCQLIGAFRMQWSTVTDDWTVSALGNNDGIGRTQLEKIFSTVWTMPLGQNGASAGTYILPNGGTAMIFGTNDYTYKINNNGFVHAIIMMDNDGGTDGVGAVGTQIALPYANLSALGYIHSSAEVQAGGAFTGDHLYVKGTGQTAYIILRDDQDGDLNLASFTNADRRINTSFFFRAF